MNLDPSPGTRDCEWRFPRLPGLDDDRLTQLVGSLAKDAGAAAAGIHIAQDKETWSTGFLGPLAAHLGIDASLDDGVLNAVEDWFEIDDIAADSRFTSLPCDHAKAACRHYAAVPIRIDSIQMQGFIWLLWKNPGRVGKRERNALRTFASLLKEILELKYCNVATGVANETHFIQALGHMLGVSDAGVTVGYINLWAFQRLNNAYGHNAGRELLSALAKRLVIWSDSDAIVGHLGGDRFAFALPGKLDLSSERLISLQRTISRTIPLSCGRQHSVRARLGLRVVSAHCGLDPSVVLQEASSASTSATLTSAYLYQPASRLKSEMLIGLSELLCDEGGQGMLEVHYEPQFDLVSGCMTSMEALVRWRHPVAGLVFPKDFVPFLEQVGKMSYLDMFVLRLVCQDIQAWRAAGVTAVPIALNFARESLLVEGIVEKIQEQLAFFGIDGRHLECEITESSAVDTKRLQTCLLGLRSLGMRVAIDDFGTGHSNFETICELTFDKLKVDRQFINGVATDPRLAELLRLIIDIARLFDAEIICEGVEQFQDLHWLTEHGLARFQGWYFSRALPPSQAIEAIRHLAHPAQVLNHIQLRDTIEKVMRTSANFVAL